MPADSVTDLLDPIDERVRKIMREEARKSVVSFVDPAYSGTGRFKDRRINETSTPNITKPVLCVFGLAHGNGTAVAGDKVIYTEDGRHAIGIEGDPGGTINAGQWGGLGHASPGTGVTLDTAATEQNTTSTSFVEVKRFLLSLPGRYRVSLALARSANTTEAKLQLLLLDGVTWIDVSAVASSTSTHPTFSTHSLDMTITANCAGMILRVVYRQVTAGTSYIKDAAVKYTETATAPALHHAVLLD